MKIRVLLFVVVLFAGLASARPAQDLEQAAEPFLGRWSLYLPGGAGWLEVTTDKGYLDANLLWYGGSVLPVASVYLDGDALVVTRTRVAQREKDEQGEAVRSHILTHLITLHRSADRLIGESREPNNSGMGVNVARFWGEKIPPLPPAPDLSKVKFGRPITLFNGRDLSGWELTDASRKNGFVVVDGALVNDPVQPETGRHLRYGNIRTVDEFEDFNLKLQVRVPKGNNSGIYLRGIYEVQVLDSYGLELDSHHMGAIYSRITPSTAAERPAGEWQDLDITLCDRHATVILNGTLIIDNEPLLGVTGGALSADQFSPGPIYLQGDHGHVSYRNIVLTPILK